jgi:hypothetical protein
LPLLSPSSSSLLSSSSLPLPEHNTCQVQRNRECVRNSLSERGQHSMTEDTEDKTKQRLNTDKGKRQQEQQHLGERSSQVIRSLCTNCDFSFFVCFSFLLLSCKRRT